MLLCGLILEICATIKVEETERIPPMNNIYDASLENQQGEEIPLSPLILLGKVHRGQYSNRLWLDPQYCWPQDLYLCHKEKGLEILDIPCNQFMGRHQERQKKSLASVAPQLPDHLPNDSLKPRSMVKKPFLSMTGSKAKQLGHWANAHRMKSFAKFLSSTNKATSPNRASPLQTEPAAMEDLIQDLWEINKAWAWTQAFWWMNIYFETFAVRVSARNNNVSGTVEFFE